MEKLINLYKDLDPINLIIFWGIVIVIILIIILIILMIVKKQKTKKIHIEENNYNGIEEDLPIKKENTNTQQFQTDLEEENIFNDEENNIFDIPEEEFNEPQIEEPKDIVNPTIPVEETLPEEDFIIKEEPIVKEHENKYPSKEIEIPTRPYQRNVLREMSLSQTSPIGINKRDVFEKKQRELREDLSSSLNYEKEESNYIATPTIPVEETLPVIEPKIKEELKTIENESPRKTEIVNETKFPEPMQEDYDNIEEDFVLEPEENQYSLPKELLEIDSELEPVEDNNDHYLEEVSKKLAETDYSNEIERTEYEIEQEENAIISYQELMEKKDSIQTIDEEDAIISIEELMNRANNKNQEIEQDNKLYNINENEENDQFIKELKQFRQDL